MKKFISTAIAASLMAGSTAAVAAPTLNRATAPVDASEEAGVSTTLAVLIFAAVAAGIILFIEENDDDDDLPTSP